MISYNVLIIWLLLILFVLIVINKWNEKRLIRQVEKILSPIKKDALFDAPKLNSQHLKSPFLQKLDARELSDKLELPDGFELKVQAPNTSPKGIVIKSELLSKTEFNQSENISQKQTHVVIENVAVAATNLTSEHREIDATYDEMLENMAKRASLRKNNSLK